jgi:hypothetical protein
MSDYYKLTVADGISGDDVNRHRREASLGYAAPDPTWADSDKEIRCIHPGQHFTKFGTLTGKIYFHNAPATFMNCPVVDVITIPPCSC